MTLSFAAMLGFASVAAWLWLRQRDAPPPATDKGAIPAKARPAEVHREPEPREATEFVAVPGQREEDSPVTPAGEHTEFVPPPSEQDEPVERTEFIANPSALRAAPIVEERTAFVAPPPAIEERTSFVAPPPQLAVEERTSFVAPPIFDAPPVVSSQPPLREAPDSSSPRIAPAIDPPKTDPTAALREHFDLAVVAFATLEQQEDADESTRLHGHLEVLGSAAIDPLLEVVRPALVDSNDARVGAAWLALLQHKTWPAKRALPQLLAELDERSRTEALRALASWDDPRAASLASAGLEHDAGTPEREVEWLELFATRGWDPGDAAIDRALSSTHARLLVAGLRLAGSRKPEQVRAKVSAQLFASDPAVRIEAIETALVFAEQSAWLVCRQLARNPAFPRAAELVGLLGSETEVAQLCQAASIAGSAPLVWGLGLSGRPIALEACAAALDDTELRAAASAALALALGRELDSPAAVREVVAKHDAPRLIGGAPRTLAALAKTLADTDSLPLRRAIARELRIRARGRVISTPELRPPAYRRQLDELRSLDLDLNRDFPWHAESR